MIDLNAYPDTEDMVYYMLPSGGLGFSTDGYPTDTSYEELTRAEIEDLFARRDKQEQEYRRGAIRETLKTLRDNDNGNNGIGNGVLGNSRFV